MISTIIIAVILVGICGWIVYGMRKNKKQGKSSCGCGCSNCAMSEICHKNQQ